MLEKGLAPVRYVDDGGSVTEVYPFNPNGSPVGIAARCALRMGGTSRSCPIRKNGLKWNWGWMPGNEKKAQGFSLA